MILVIKVDETIWRTLLVIESFAHDREPPRLTEPATSHNEASSQSRAAPPLDGMFVYLPAQLSSLWEQEA